MEGEQLTYRGVFVTMSGTVLRTVKSHRGLVAVVEWDNGSLQEILVSKLDLYR